MAKESTQLDGEIPQVECTCMWSMVGMVLVVILENIWVLLLGKNWIAGKKKIYGFIAIRTKKGKSAHVGKVYKIGI